MTGERTMPAATQFSPPPSSATFGGKINQGCFERASGIRLASQEGREEEETDE